MIVLLNHTNVNIDVFISLKSLETAVCEEGKLPSFGKEMMFLSLNYQLIGWYCKRMLHECWPWVSSHLLLQTPRPHPVFHKEEKATKEWGKRLALWAIRHQVVNILPSPPSLCLSSDWQEPAAGCLPAGAMFENIFQFVYSNFFPSMKSLRF